MLKRILVITMFSLVLNVYANAPTKPKEFPTPLGCGEYDGAEGSWWSTCQKLNSVAAANWWTEQMVGFRFENNTSSSHYLYFKEGGELFGWLPISDSENGLQMTGAWEVDVLGNKKEKLYITIYAGQAECRYSVSKKGTSFYWFENFKKNYSNICPSMLTKRIRIP